MSTSTIVLGALLVMSLFTLVVILADRKPEFDTLAKMSELCKNVCGEGQVAHVSAVSCACD